MEADCLIAGTLASSGAAHDLLDLWEDGRFELIACPNIIYEVEKSLRHPRIANKYGITQQEAKSFGHRLSEEGMLVNDPKNPPRIVPDDPNDDYLIALGLGTEASFLVTRDHHFAKVRIPSLPIVSPRQMLDRLRDG
ncbi:MAG: PIN domain-containing protein [Actinomycetota bacterium]